MEFLDQLRLPYKFHGSSTRGILDNQTMLNYASTNLHFSIFTKLRFSDECNQVKSCSKTDKPTCLLGQLIPLYMFEP